VFTASTEVLSTWLKSRLSGQVTLGSTVAFTVMCSLMARMYWSALSAIGRGASMASPQLASFWHGARNSYCGCVLTNT